MELLGQVYRIQLLPDGVQSLKGNNLIHREKKEHLHERLAQTASLKYSNAPAT